LLTPGERRFHSLDDFDVADTARRDPEALLAGSTPVTLDEVQRQPSLLSAVKRAIDRQRRAGQFLLTGSANSEESAWPDVLRSELAHPEDWRALARRGGFPTPAVHIKAAGERAVWFEGYVRTYLERDLQVLSSISALPDFRRLMRAACLRLGQLVNQTELARDVALPQPTVHRYLNLLEISFLLVPVTAYAANRTKRLIKTPKLYWGDVGVALHLAGLTEPTGAHLENIVLHDLLCWRDARTAQAEILYWRTTTGEEVDFVLETGGRLLPIEVKATARPRLADATKLRSFRAEYGKLSRAGLLLHTGTQLEWITPDVLAAPWWTVC
jgi:uncharacterized protein